MKVVGKFKYFNALVRSSRVETEMLMQEKREKWINENPSIKSWLENLQPKTQVLYGGFALKYFTWIKEEASEPFKNKSPCELINLQDTCVRQREQFKQVDLLRKYLNQKDGTFNTKSLIKSAIYSFYASNRVPLPRDKNFKVKPTREGVNGDLTIEELKSIILSSNKLYQAVFTIMFQSGMGENEFLYFNTHSWPQVKEQLDEGKTLIRVDLPGRKHRNMKPRGRYFTFFGKDGIAKLKQYLEVRGKNTRNGRTIERPLPTLEECIFVTERWEPLTEESISTYFKRHAIKLGIIKKVYGKKIIRYRAHAHEMRDTFRKEWNLTDAKQFMSEFFLGHSVDKNEYNKVFDMPDFAEEQYSIAEPYLNILAPLSEDPRVISKKDVRTLQKELTLANKKLEELESLRADGKHKELEISALNTLVTTEFKKVYAAFDRLKEEHRKTMEELDKEPTSSIPDPKALREEVRKEARKVTEKLKEQSSS